uniref:Uncharacterized protein n=1 Tax=Cryptosporidium parvum TaxID=5807 RepID=F0X5S2_CRYPV
MSSRGRNGLRIFIPFSFLRYNGQNSKLSSRRLYESPLVSSQQHNTKSIIILTPAPSRITPGSSSKIVIIPIIDSSLICLLSCFAKIPITCQYRVKKSCRALPELKR